jgi:rare lipoprotein A (peptidoglycan hydrolase)
MREIAKQKDVINSKEMMTINRISQGSPEVQYADEKVIRKSQLSKADADHHKNNREPWEVQKGESLWAIAQKMGFKGSEIPAVVKAIALANDLADPSKLSIGQKLRIPFHLDNKDLQLKKTQDKPTDKSANSKAETLSEKASPLDGGNTLLGTIHPSINTHNSLKDRIEAKDKTSGNSTEDKSVAIVDSDVVSESKQLEQTNTGDQKPVPIKIRDPHTKKLITILRGVDDGKEYFVGEGSWYADPSRRKDPYHGLKTASGRIMDGRKMTCAMNNTGLLGKDVLVTNLKTHEKQVLKVIDTGPHSKAKLSQFKGHHRLIDVSYAAAQKLNIIGSGYAPLQVDVIG